MSSNTQILYIKNMVCPRCKLAVKKLLTDMGCVVLAVELGQAVVRLSSLPALSSKLRTMGFDLLTTPKTKLVERIKILLIYNIYFQSRGVTSSHLQSYLEFATHQHYQYLNSQFYSVCQISIKQYWDILRFERAKELLSYNEKAPEEITRQLGYLSSRDLEDTFKKRLNLSIEEFIYHKDNYRLPLDKLLQINI
ncbi:helix-turn-helix domain-containing protein [Fodinibius sp. SL11]|uniref:helix-turn-helix domain-containing protein n=1 Tax=Fodinibius sp. SL11 TaxID=3425690 RepID=UPI003F8829D9